MGRIYSVVFSSVAVTGAQDFFELTSGSGLGLLVHGWELSQSTEVGDAQEEEVVILLKRGTSGTTSGSGGSAPTPQPLETSQGAATFTAEVNNTTKMSAGTIVTLYNTAWNERMSPWTVFFPPELRPYARNGERITLELNTTVADSVTFSGVMWVEEIG